MKRPPIALTIAGTDPSGGAGIHADLKTFCARGVYGTSAITAVVAQNTHGVSDVQGIDDAFVRAQLAAVLDDMPVDASKTGMLATKSLVELVCDVIDEGRLGFLVVDPVMVATSGHRLLAQDALRLVRERLLLAADLITPNLPEAALLLGDDVALARTVAEAWEQARELIARGAKGVLLKGGHATDDIVTDILLLADGTEREFHHPRLHTPNTHGTGCTLSAAIAAEMAKRRHQFGRKTISGHVEDAVDLSLDYLARALQSAAEWQLSYDPSGAHGPVNHQVDNPLANFKESHG